MMPDSNPRDASRDLNPETATSILEHADLAVKAGMPLAPGLRAMADETSAAGSRKALRQMADRLEQGESLPAVLSSLQPHLAPLMSVLLEQEAGLGRLDTVLHWIAENARRRRVLRNQIRSALAYPVILLLAGIMVMGALLFGITPRFSKIFDDFGTQVPPLTRAVVSVSHFVVDTVTLLLNYWYITLIVLPLGLAAFVIACRLSSPIMRGRWIYSIPIIGPLFRLEAQAEFCNLMALLIELHLPMEKSLRLAAHAATSPWLQHTCLTLAADLQQGELYTGSARLAGMPVAICQILRRTGSPEAMVESLRGLGSLYAARTEVNSRFVTIIAEPFILTLTVLGVGLLVTALFLPLISLLRDLS